MGFFDDLGKKTADKTTKITKEAKLKLKISENKSKVKDLYVEIGKKVYEKYVREEDIIIKDFINEECQKLAEISKEIEDARMEILNLNNKKLCSKCFAEIEKDMQFCPRCGEKQNDEKTVLEKAEEKLENADISEKNEAEAKIVKEELENKNEE